MLYTIFIFIIWRILVWIFAFFFRSDESEDEIDDSDINKILIVMQTPPALRKHPQGDRTGDYQSRSKITAELGKVINDGLFYYEKDLWEEFSVSQWCQFSL